MNRVLTALALSATLLATTSARADEPIGADKPEPAKSESRWYGYQTLATDGAALALVGLAIAADDNSTAQSGFLIASAATYAVAPAVIHGTHGNPGRAVGDVAIRLFTPVLGTGIGFAIGAATSQDQGDFGPLLGGIVGGAIGFASGIAVAMALDASVLAYESGPVEKKTVAKAGPTITPSVGPTKNGFAAGLVGTF